MAETKNCPFSAPLDIYFEALETVAVPALVAGGRAGGGGGGGEWYNQTLCNVNDSVVRLGVIQGEYHWHKHDHDDEFFFVVEGKLLIDLEDKIAELGPRQGFVVPKECSIEHERRSAR